MGQAGPHLKLFAMPNLLCLSRKNGKNEEKKQEKNPKISETPYFTSGIKCGTNLEASGPGDNQVSNVVLRDANELPSSRGFQIVVTLHALLTFLKSGDFSGQLKEV